VELSPPWCSRDIQVKVPVGFLAGASPGMGRLWLPRVPERGVWGFAEVPAACLQRVFCPAVLGGALCR